MKMELDRELRCRAEAVIPGGMYGHMAIGARMPAGYPQYFGRAEGCRLWDADGNEYIDYMCGYGPMILGYGNERVAARANAQRTAVDTCTGPAPVIVELAERFVDQVSAAAWSMFAKNGNDATTICVQIARAHTQKQVVLVAENAYHGAQPWCNRISPGILAEDHTFFHRYRYNDVASVEAAVDAAHGDLAAIMVSAFKHDAGFDQELADPGFARRVRELCDEHGALLLLDDVRAGFRLSLDASWSAFGVDPDVTAWGKAIANGEPLAAVTGSEAARAAAASLFTTGSFWCQAAPMAAAIETLDILVEADAPRYLERIGQLLRDGLEEQAVKYGHPVRQTGPVQMPLVLFEEDRSLGQTFCAHLIREGVYMHPWHNMFISTAHTEADVEITLAATSKAFEALG